MFRMRTDFKAGYLVCDISDAVRVGDRVIPRLIEVTCPAGPDWPELQLTIEVVKGIPRCTRAQIKAGEDGEVRSKDLRALQVEDWIEDMIALVARRVTAETDGIVTSVLEAGEGAARGAIATVREARKGARRTVTDELLAEVARVYRENIDGNPTEAVKVALGREYRTAARYVQLARAKGLLPETSQGQRKA